MKRALVFSLVLLLLVLPGCGLFSSAKSSPEATGSPSPSVVLKPKPSVVDVTASTSGQLDYYYAILDITIKNDGADGTVLVTANVTQGGVTQGNVTQGQNIQTREVPVSLAKNAKEMLRLIFPLKWKGGDWTPSVRIEVP
jgi:hypothetical protein